MLDHRHERIHVNFDTMRVSTYRKAPAPDNRIHYRQYHLTAKGMARFVRVTSRTKKSHEIALGVNDNNGQIKEIGIYPRRDR